MEARNRSRRVKMRSIAVALLVAVLVGRQMASGAQGDCGQPVSSGTSPVASDCLFILRVAVGLQLCTPQTCVCDPGGDGSTTANDALLCLKKVVGEAVTLSCPCTTTTSTTTTTVPDTADCTNDGSCGNDDCGCSS